MQSPGLSDHWFEPVADRMGRAYLRYSHTKGTTQEIDFLVGALGLIEGSRVLDVGCGPGRHSHELARRGVVTHGIDISQRFIDIATADAPPGVTFERADARSLTFDSEFDAVICLCQGAFGMMRGSGEDEAVLHSIARAVRPGGVIALSAFNAYFVVRFHDEASFDADQGLSHERTDVRDESGNTSEIDLWTGCYTPRELRLLLAGCGLVTESVWGVEPGRYAAEPPSTELPEYLVIARRSADVSEEDTVALRQTTC